MRYQSVLSLLALVIGCCSSAVSQINPMPCSAAVNANGFIDWTKLPAPKPGVALNAAIPVAGLQDLTATVEIPAVTPRPGALNGSSFAVNSPIALLVAANATVTLVFNHPVKGVSVSIGISGRFNRGVRMRAYVSPDSIALPVPPDAEVTASAFDFPSPGDVATAPLQIRSATASIRAVVIQFTGDGFEYFSYEVINLRVEDASAPDPSKQVPANGLKQWLRADTVLSNVNFYPRFPSWPDQSGNHADATSPDGVLALPDGPNCAAAVLVGDKLSANLPINGWTGMTIFFVSKSNSDVGGWWENQALYWEESESWGATFLTPSQTNAFFRFGTTQTNNQPIYARPVNVGGDYTLTTAIHDGNTDRLYVNGVLALRQGGKRAVISGVTSTEWIGAGLNNTFFSGSIGEILVYDRALSGTEREIVEHYLMKKFGLF